MAGEWERHIPSGRASNQAQSDTTECDWRIQSGRAFCFALIRIGRSTQKKAKRSRIDRIGFTGLI